MAIRQVTTPNVNIGATRGWCLKYVDDAVNAPSRKPTAQAAFNTESANGNIRQGDTPVGVWVPIFFSLNTGPNVGLGHVAWAYNHGNGDTEIHDSETQSGARAVYTSIAQVLAWFGKQNPEYEGWSYWVDGAHIVEDYTPAPTPNPESGSAKGTATVVVDTLNVRNEPSTSATVVATYGKGDKFNYDSFITTNGYVWLSYVSYSGQRRYVAEGPDDGKDDTVYVSGGV